MRRLASALALAGLLALPAPALAAPPTIVDVFDKTDVLQIDEFYFCPDFVVSATFYAERTDKVFYDRHGDPVRIQIHVQFSGTLTNTSNGKSLPDSGAWRMSMDLETGEITFTGGVRVITAPGAGNLLQDTGREVYDADFNNLFSAGKHEDNEFGTPELCAALE